jgi:hypothetical protein
VRTCRQLRLIVCTPAFIRVSFPANNKVDLRVEEKVNGPTLIFVKDSVGQGTTICEEFDSHLLKGKDHEHSTKIRLRVWQQPHRRRRRHEKPAWRQGCQPGRDVPAGHCRAVSGFTISTEACTAFTEQGREAVLALIQAQVLQGVAFVEPKWASKFGNAKPLLLSVRSGARASMPGMMDTILNLGSTTRRCSGWRARPTTNVLPGTRTAALSRCMATW